MQTRWLYRITYFYLTIPFIIFCMGWLRLSIAIPVVAVIVWVLWQLFKQTQPDQFLASNFRSAVYCLLIMWDRKRQLIWLGAGLLLGTFVAYSDAHDEDGTFVPRFFIFMESLVLIIIATLFYIYSRRKG